MAFTLLNRLLSKYSFDQSGLLSTEGILPYAGATAVNVTSVESFARRLDLTGDGTGTKDITGNFSAGADIFFFTPQANKTYLINKITITIRDVGLMNSATFGALTALTNGITFKHTRNAVDVRTFFTTVKVNGDLSDSCDEYFITELSATEENILRASFNFPEPLVLSATAIDKLEYAVNDNFAGILHQFVTVHGLEITTA